MQDHSFDPVTSAPRIQRGQPVFDAYAWIRLPRPGTRCPVSGLSRSGLAELVRPCPRNSYRAPVEARVLKRRGAARGVLLVNRAALLAYIAGQPAPEASAPREVSP